MLLAQYDDTPTEGVVVYVDNRDDVQAAMLELTGALKLEPEDLVWLRDEEVKSI